MFESCRDRQFLSFSMKPVDARPDRRLDAYFPEGLFRETSDHGLSYWPAQALAQADVAVRSRPSLSPDGRLRRLPAIVDALDAGDRGSGRWSSRGRSDAPDERRACRTGGARSRSFS